jgi:hypothetical protein
MPSYNPYDESTYNPTQKVLSRPLTAPSFNPNRSTTRIPTTSPSVPPASTADNQGGGKLTTMPAAAPIPVGGGATGGVPPQSGGNANPNAVPSASEDLAKWGYTGEIPINNLEQQAIDFVNNMYGSGGSLGTINNAQSYYDQVLQGKYGPEGQAYLQQVLDPMRTSQMRDYGEMSKALATKFSDIGGFYGGRAGIAQGRLASDTANNMAQNEANLRYQGFNDNMNRMGGAASGQVGLAQAQSEMSGDMLNYLLTTGGMVTGRDALNRSQYQQAMQNSYNDWMRARQENLLPFSWGQSLVGQQAVQPVVTQTPSAWGQALGSFGQIGAAAVPFI